MEGNPKTKFYRDYEKFDTEKIKTELYSNINKKEVYCYFCFHEAFTNLLHKYNPIKKKIARYNNNPYMARTPVKLITLRSKLKNSYNKNRSAENWDKFKRQGNSHISKH